MSSAAGGGQGDGGFAGASPPSPRTAALLESFRAENMAARPGLVQARLDASSFFGMPALPPGALCAVCEEPAIFLTCNCTAPHYTCADCYSMALRSALGTGPGATNPPHICCPIAQSEQAMGDVARGRESGLLLGFGLQVLQARGEKLLSGGAGAGAGGAPSGKPTAEEEHLFFALEAVNSQRLQGVLTQTCPLVKTCGGAWVAPTGAASQPPPPGTRPVGRPEQCQQGSRPGSTAARCPCIFCVYCGEVWEEGHAGKQCGTWRPPPPDDFPPGMVKNCPNCNFPHIHSHGHGCE